MKLFGKCALISGSSRGFGFEVARQFVIEGASVMLCARETMTLQKAYEQLLPLTHPTAKIRFQTTDISDNAQVEYLIQKTLKEFGNGMH